MNGVVETCRKLHSIRYDGSFIDHAYITVNPAFPNVRFSVELYNRDPFALKERRASFMTWHCQSPCSVEQMLALSHEHSFIVILDTSCGRMLVKCIVKNGNLTALLGKISGSLRAPCQLWIGVSDGNELLSCIYSSELECNTEQLAKIFLIHSHLETAWKNSRKIRSIRQELDTLHALLLDSRNKTSGISHTGTEVKLITPRQIQVIEQVVLGKDNQQIADELDISVLTVKKHLQTIFQVMKVQHRTELAAKWRLIYPGIAD